MRAGILRHVIDIQDGSQTTDGMGGFTTSWAAASGLAGLRAAIWPLRGNERIDSMKMEMVVTHRIRLRYRSGIYADMRVKFGTRYFDIKAVTNPDERNIMIELLCEEIDGSG